jgi:hypothetical protein
MSLTTDRAAMARRRRRLIAEGLCTGCGKVPPRAGRRKCEACGQKDTARAMRRFNRRSAPLQRLGICPRCATRQVMPGTKICGVCSERWMAYKETLRAKYRAAGLCLWCGGARDRADRILCLSCREKQSAAHRNRTAALREAS